MQANLQHLSARPHQPLPSIDPGHLVVLVHAASSLGHYHASLYGAAAAVLLPNLDELPTEELVLATWAYATTLRAASASGRSCNAAASAVGAEVLRNTNIATSGGGGKPLRQHLAVLRGLSDMLAAAVPQGRPDALLPGELQLLWQAQALCDQWRVRSGGSDGSSGGSNGSSSGCGSEAEASREAGGGSDAASESPLQLHPRLFEGGELQGAGGCGLSCRVVVESRPFRMLVWTLLIAVSRHCAVCVSSALSTCIHRADPTENARVDLGHQGCAASLLWP